MAVSVERLLLAFVVTLLLVSVQAQKKKATPPRNVRSDSVTTSSITLAWDRPKKIPRGLTISGFKLLYRLLGDGTQKKLDIPETTTYTVPDLAAGTDYEVKMATITSNRKIGGFTDWIQVTTAPEQAAPPPNPPQNVRAGASGTSIMMEWTPPQGAFDGYVVSYGVGSTDENSVTLSQEETGTTLENLQPGTMYQVSLQSARGDQRSQPLSLEVETGVPVPSAPGTIRLRSTSDSIDVEWSHNAAEAEGVTGFELNVGPDSNPTEQTIQMESTDRYTTVSGLTPDQVYVVSLKAQNQFGSSPPIADKISTQPAPRARGPPQPTGMRASADADSVTVNWGEPRGDVDGYVLSVGPQSNPTEFTERIPRGTSEYRVGNLQPGTDYMVSLKSLNSAGESQPLEQAIRTQARQRPAPPPGMRMSSGPDSINVEWASASGNIAGYRLDVGPASNPSEFSQEFPPRATSHTVENLQPDTEYQVRLVSTDRRGTESAPLEQTIRTTGLSPPPSFTMTASESTIDVNWVAPSGNIDGYNIQVAETRDPTNVVYKETLSPLDQSHTISRLEPGTPYTVSMTSYLGDAVSQPISQTVTTIDAPTRPDPPSSSGPRQPSGVQVTAEGTNLRVQWNPNPPSDRLTEYRLRAGRAQDGVPTENEQMVRPSKNQYLFRDLEPQTDYVVSVTAVNREGESRPSMATARTEAPVPRSPEGLSADTTPTTARLTWRPTGDQIEGYRLHLGTSASPRLFSETVAARQTSFTFEDLEPNTLYTAELESYNSYGMSEPVTTKLRTLPAPPRDPPRPPGRVEVTSTPERINIRWLPARGRVEGYRITARDTETGEEITAEVGPREQRYAFADLVPGREYEVTIQSFGPDGESDPEVQNISTEPAPETNYEPRMVEAIPTGTQIDVSWQAPELPRGQSVNSYVVIAEVIDPNGDRGDRESVTLHHSQRDHTFYNLQPATNYRVSVAANVGGTVRSPVVQEAQTTLSGPIPPVNIRAEPIAPSAVSVSWDFPVETGPPQGGGGRRRPDIYYTVRARSTESGEMYSNSRSLTANVTGLQPDTVYQVAVAMVFDGQVSDYSDVFAVRTFSNIDAAAPQFLTPTQVLLEFPESVNVIFNWLPPREDAADVRGYSLDYTLAEDAEGSNVTWDSVQADADSLGVVVSGLPTSQIVSYRIQPLYRGGRKGPFSAIGALSTPVSERPVPPDQPCQSHQDVTEQRINQMTERGVPPLGMPLPFCDQFFSDFPCVWTPVCVCIPRGTTSLSVLPNSIRPSDGPGCGTQGDSPRSGPGPCKLIFDKTMEAMQESRKQGLPLMASALPNCRDDGYYGDIQCSGSMCMCVDEMGEPTGKMTQLWNVATLNCGA